MAIRHQVEFLEGHNFIWREDLEDWGTSPCQILSKFINCGDIAIFWFLKMAAATILIFQIREILLAEENERARRTILPNFVKIGQSVVEILRFFICF